MMSVESVIESEERLRIATEVAEVFAWDIDLVAHVMKWAPNSHRVIGCKAEELQSDPDNSTFFASADDRVRIALEMRFALERGDETFSIKFRGLAGHPDKSFWHLRGICLRNENGIISRVVGATQNITKQKMADDALHFVAERLATAEEASGALIYDWDFVTDKVWRSGGLTRILGWDIQEIGEGMAGWIKLRHPDDEVCMSQSVYTDYFHANDNYVLEYRVRHKNGHYVWVLDSGRIFRDAAGVVVRVAGATIDISPRKEVEASILRQKNLIDLSFEPIFVWEPERGIVEWNNGAAQLYGFGREEAIGKSSQILLRTKSPIDPEKLLDILKKQKSWTGELENRAKDGRRIFVESRQQVIDNDGGILILETNHDISQRKQAESYTARMAAVAVASHDALFGITLDGLVETWNPAAERLFGYSAAEIIGEHISILAEPSKHEEQRELMRKAQSNQTVGPYDAKRLRKDGTSIDVSIALAPVTAADGGLIALSVAIHDISDRKEWEARQRLMTRELAHRIKNSFAVLQGILRSTLRTSRDPQEFAEAFSGRLHSLSAAQDVLTDNDWKGAELGTLARHQLAAYVSNEDSRVDITGPVVNLPAEYAAPVGLIFNELATNAMKYGALSVPEGNIQLFWQTERTSDGSIKIAMTWRERGGPTITSQGRRGFGSALIEKSLAGSKVENYFEPEGLTCKIELTVKTLKTLRSKRKVKIARLSEKN